MAALALRTSARLREQQSSPAGMSQRSYRPRSSVPVVLTSGQLALGWLCTALCTNAHDWLEFRPLRLFSPNSTHPAPPTPAPSASLDRMYSYVCPDYDEVPGPSDPETQFYGGGGLKGKRKFTHAAHLSTASFCPLEAGRRLSSTI